MGTGPRPGMGTGPPLGPPLPVPGRARPPGKVTPPRHGDPLREPGAGPPHHHLQPVAVRAARLPQRVLGRAAQRLAPLQLAGLQGGAALRGRVSAVLVGHAGVREAQEEEPGRL